MKLKLSISVLISDRAETAGKCLHSLIPLLQAVPSELIVVYTGSEEESLKIARQYTDHIIPFTWCDDFSAARNAGLKEASGEWFLYIDDDEWFEDCTEIIDFFKSGEYKKYESAAYLQRNYKTMDGEGYSDIAVRRISRRTAQTRFVGTIHEQLRPLIDPVRYFQTFVHHYSYAIQSKDGIMISSERNIPMLLKAIEKEPDNIKNYLQLAQEYYGTRQYKEAVEYCHKILEMSGEEKSANKCREWASAFLVASLIALGEEEEALSTGVKILDKQDINELATIYISMSLLPLCNQLKKFEEGIALSDLLWRYKDELDRNPKLWDEQQILGLTRESIDKNIIPLLQNELLCAASIEEYEKAGGYLLRFPWNTDEMTNTVYEFFENWKCMFDSKVKNILECFSSLSVEDDYVTFQKALLAELNQKEEKTKELYLLCGKTDNIYIRYQSILMAMRKKYPLPEFVDYMDLDTWRSCAATLVESGFVEDFDSFTITADLLFYRHPIHRLVLEQKVLPRLMLQHKGEEEEFNRIVLRYCQVVIELNEKLHRDELFEPAMMFCLPIECRAAMALREAMTLLEQGNHSSGIRALREMITTYPDLAVLVDKIISNLEENHLKRVKTPNKEFETLGNQIKFSLKQMMTNQQYKDALPIAEKLCELLPEDMEIVKWKQKILKSLAD